jgi:hypothetical protein
MPVMRCGLPYGPADEVHGPFSAAAGTGECSYRRAPIRVVGT